MPAEREAFVAAVALVCEQSFFMFAEPASPDVAARVAEDTTWFEVTVKFSGPYSGTLSVAIPELLASDLFASFLGFEDSDLPALECVEDLMGEFANMACGSWLSQLTTTECFALEHPVVAVTPSPALVGATLLSVNDQPLAINARFAEAA